MTEYTDEISSSFSDDSENSSELSNSSDSLSDSNDEIYELRGILKNLYEFHNNELPKKSEERLKINIANENYCDFEKDDECPHKTINCKIISPCCGKVFTCNRCHDKYYDDKKNSHTIDKSKITRVVCMNCGEYQDISNCCTKCKITFAKYYCDKCKVFDSSSDNHHCDKCNLCIIGTRNDFIHCDTCKCCMEKSHFYIHKCLPDVLEGMCSVCMDLLKNGEKLLLVICGHALHEECYNNLMKSSYKCPKCSKTIKDMKYNFSLLDNDIKNQPMPEIKIIRIKCNDCDKISDANYHYLGTKCKYCGSYNTYEQ